MSTTTQGEASTKAPDNVRGVILQCFTLKMYPPSPKNNRMSSTQNYNTPLCACDNLQPPPSTIKKFSPYPSGSEKIQSPLLCPSTKQLLPNTKFLLTSEKTTSPNVKLASGHFTPCAHAFRCEAWEPLGTCMDRFYKAWTRNLSRQYNLLIPYYQSVAVKDTYLF